MVVPKPSRPKGRLFFILAALLVVILFVAAFLFPFLLKRYIENNSEAWIGRKITIGRIVLNPLTGVYAVTDLVCSEPRSERVFVRFDKLAVKGSVIDGLMNDHWDLREAELRNPYLHIAQNGDRFNFSDLLELGGGEGEDNAVDESAEVVFTVVDIALTDGRIDYESDLLNEPLQIIDLEITSTRITSVDDRMDFIVGMGMLDGTRLDGGFMIDTDSAFYAVDARLRKFELAGSLPYLQDFFQAGSLMGQLDVDLHVRQSYKDSSQLALSARMDLRGLELRDPKQERLLSLDRFHARLDTLVNDHFDLGIVEVDGLDTRFALFADSTDNWTRLLKLASDTTNVGAEGMVLDASESNYFVLLADYISYLGSAITTSDYTADSIVFSRGRLRFEDHSIPRTQHYDISDIELRAKRFTAESEAAPVAVTATLNGVGKVSANAAFDPKDLRNVDLRLVVDSLMMAPLDPYMLWFAAHPPLDGVVRYESRTIIRDGQIDSQNLIHIDRLKFGKRQDQHSPDIYVLPLRLAVGLLKDAKGVIELDLPVKGDLRDPEFKVWPIIWQVLKNLVVKAVTAPAKMIARMFEGVDERDLELVRFRELQVTLEKPQEHVLNELAKALAMKPEFTAELLPLADSLAEAGQLALFIAKARFMFPSTPVLGREDSLRVQELAVRDSSFVRWMDERSPSTRDLGMAERSTRLLGASESMLAWRQLENARREQVMQFLLSAGVGSTRVRFASGTPAEMATYGGLPGYFFRYGAAEEGE